VSTPNRTGFRRLAAAALLGTCVSTGAAALTDPGTKLYDASLGTLPIPQGWASPLATAAETIQTDGMGNPVALLFDTTQTASNSLQDGNIRSNQILDTGAGFELSWRLRIVSEAHANTNRGGFSLILVGNQPEHALELAFWTDQVWAYDFLPFPTGFVHGPSYLVDTTIARDYRLRVQNHHYSLFVDNAAAFTGALVDYSAPIGPYDIPNALFFGDDTSSARAGVELEHITLSAIPLPGAFILCAPAFAALLVASRRRARA
jgi:hypothetical protein